MAMPDFPDPRIVAFIKRGSSKILEPYIARKLDEDTSKMLENDLKSFLAHWVTTPREEIQISMRGAGKFTDISLTNPMLTPSVCPKIYGPHYGFDAGDGLIHASCFLNTERARLCDLELMPDGRIRRGEPITCLQCLLTPEAAEPCR
jgi:hypothetical protein